MRLYELPQAYEALYSRLVDSDGEMTPDDVAELTHLDATLESKAKNICKIVLQASSEASAIAEEVARLTKLLHARQATAARLKEYLLTNMQVMNVGKIQIGSLGNVRVQKNSRPTIRWTEHIEELPLLLQRVTVEVDLQAAYEQWKDTGSLPEGFLVEHVSHLRIG